MYDPDYQEREKIAVSAIKSVIPSKLKQDLVLSSSGLFAELYKCKLFPNHYLACAIDGVGTKLLIAQALEKYDSVGIDLVAMCANDLATLSVEPFLFLDYIATQHKIEETNIIAEIVKGIVLGLEQCDVADIMHNSVRINFGKGETASVDEIICGVKPGYGFELAGAMIGFVKKEKVNTNIKVGDKIIALKSSGPHSNGYTDLRLYLLNGDFEVREEIKKRYKGRFSLEDKFEESTIGEILLKPTKIYLKTLVRVAKEYDIVGINNTGYGLKNFNRINKNVEFRINDPFEPQPIFRLMQKESKFSDKEMYQKFNMGMGFFIIAHPEDAESVIGLCEKYEEAKVVGEVRKCNKLRTVLEINNKKIVYEGY